MITLVFASVLLLAVAVALVDWRRGWLCALLVGVLQDPARKLTPGTPVVMTFSVLVVYAVALFAAQRDLQKSFREVTRRFGQIYMAAALVMIFLVLAALNGLATYGVELWKVPALSFFIYLMPVPAILFGYAYADSEKRLIDMIHVYTIITAVALIGTPMEYFRVKWAALGMVALPEGFIRYMPGLEIRILSGFYRAPDIMGWHAAMLASIGILFAIRSRSTKMTVLWTAVAGWGFLNCVISGRRKAVYMVAVFAAAFVWRYLRRLTMGQLLAFVFLGIVGAGLVHKLGQDEEASVYTAGTVVTREEVFSRLEGGFFETVRQFGIMGAGLGTATQGVRHFLGHDENIGWQEGGLGKLTIELGLPGVLAAFILMFVLMRTLMKISAFPDEPASSQILRVGLFALMVANIVNFLVSAQAYSDAVLTLMAAMLLGSLMGTTAMQLRAEEAAAAAATDVQPLRAAATA
jgi:hypothetical protein